MRMRRRKSPKPKRLLVLHVKRNLGKPLKNANLYKYSKGRWPSIHIYFIFFCLLSKKIIISFSKYLFSWKRNLHNLFEWILLHLNHHFSRQFFSKLKIFNFWIISVLFDDHMFLKSTSTEILLHIFIHLITFFLLLYFCVCFPI